MVLRRWTLFAGSPLSFLLSSISLTFLVLKKCSDTCQIVWYRFYFILFFCCTAYPYSLVFTGFISAFFTSIHPSSSAYSSQCRGGAGVYPCCHSTRGEEQPRQVVSLLQAYFMYTVKCFVCETVIVGMQRLLRISMSCSRMLAFSSKQRLRLRMTFLRFYARFVLVVIWLIAGL